MYYVHTQHRNKKYCKKYCIVYWVAYRCMLNAFQYRKTYLISLWKTKQVFKMHHEYSTAAVLITIAHLSSQNCCYCFYQQKYPNHEYVPGKRCIRIIKCSILLYGNESHSIQFNSIHLLSNKYMILLTIT